jgi:hypothetical protein
MAAVAQLKAVLGMDSKDFKAGMSKASKDVSGFQSQIKQVGGVIAAAFSVGAIVAAGKSLATWAGNVSDAAANAGVLTSEMLALQQASISGGLGLDGMSKLLAKVQIKLAEATSGNKEARKSFTGLGLDIEALNGLNPAQLLEEVARAAIASGRPLTALADIFGDKIGPKAVRALRDMTGADGLPKISEEAGKAADKIEELGHKWETFVEIAKRTSVSAAIPVVNFFESEYARLKGMVNSFKHGKGFSTKQGLAAGEASVQTFWADKYAKDQAEKEQRLIDEEAEKNRRMETARETEKRLREEERVKSSNDLKEQDKKDRAELEKEWAKNKSISENKAAQEKVKKEYLKQKEELAVKEDELLNPISKASPISPDSMARVGGFFGNERAGMDVYTKSLEVQREQLKIMKEDSKNAAARDEKIAELVEKLEFLQGVK